MRGEREQRASCDNGEKKPRGARGGQPRNGILRNGGVRLGHVRFLRGSLIVLLQRIFVRRRSQMEGFTGLSVVVANVPPERHQRQDKRGEAQYENRKQYAHGNQVQG